MVLAEVRFAERAGAEIGVAGVAELVQQRTDDDCGICAIAMATGLPYEEVMTAALKARMGYQPGNGMRSIYWVLGELGLKSRVLFALDKSLVLPDREIDPQRLLATCVWGRRAVVVLPSLNGWKGDHIVYWDGEALHDPTTKPNAYGPDALGKVDPLEVVILDECTAASAMRAEAA